MPLVRRQTQGKQINPRFTIIKAPSVLGLFPRGVERLPDALLAAGLGERLEARRAGRLEPPPYDDHRDRQTLLLNPKGIADYSAAIADAVGRAIDVGKFPVVLGGDCSIVLGCWLGIRKFLSDPQLQRRWFAKLK